MATLESLSHKNIGVALSRVLGMTKLLFHAVVFSADKTKMYVLSKQEGSMKKDEKTRKDGKHGEGPSFQNSLVFLVLEVVPTD